MFIMYGARYDMIIIYRAIKVYLLTAWPAPCQITYSIYVSYPAQSRPVETSVQLSVVIFLLQLFTQSTVALVSLSLYDNSGIDYLLMCDNISMIKNSLKNCSRHIYLVPHISSASEVFSIEALYKYSSTLYYYY